MIYNLSIRNVIQNLLNIGLFSTSLFVIPCVIVAICITLYCKSLKFCIKPFSILNNMSDIIIIDIGLQISKSVKYIFDDKFSISMTSLKEKEEGSEYMAKVLKLLSDRSKLEILSYIKNKKAYGSELAKQLNLTNATVSHHMSGLVNAGLVIMEKEDTKIYYRTNIEEISEVLNSCLKYLTE